MKKDYDKNYYVVKADEIEKNFDADGVAKTELLPGVYDGGIRSFKYFLKAGSSVKPELYADKTVIIFFGKGNGELEDCDGVHQNWHFMLLSLTKYHMRSVQKKTWSLSLMSLI